MWEVTSKHVIESDRNYSNRPKIVADDTCTYSHNYTIYDPQYYPQYYPECYPRQGQSFRQRRGRSHRWRHSAGSQSVAVIVVSSASAELPTVSQSRTWVSWRRPAVHVGARIPTASGDRFHPLLCAHDWFRSLFRERPRWWESSVRGDVGAAERYWDELQESEVLRDRPELLTEDKGWFIPCGLHGDAGEVSHNDSLMVISFNSLIGSGVTKNQRYLITVCKKSDMCPGTLDSLFRVIAWSFNNVLQTGIEPVVDWEGKDLMCEDPMYLAAKYKAILTHIRESSTRVPSPCRSGTTLRACAGSVAPLAPRVTSFPTDAATEMYLGGPLV